jgi:hypothetical protein
MIFCGETSGTFLVPISKRNKECPRFRRNYFFSSVTMGAKPP